MRKVLAWLLAALIALSGFAFAEGEAQGADLPTEPPLQASAPAAASAAYNGRGAARVGGEVYMAIPESARQMLVRVPATGEPVCVDRGDRIEDLIPYAGGVVYLKTENNSSAIMACNGNQITSVYAFGASSATNLNFYNGKFLVLIDGLLHSIEPGTQLCLRLSGAQMLDYAVDGDIAYYLSAGDRMEYTATLGGGETVSAQAGCVYSLDLKSGETNLLLKSGARDLEIAGGKLYFHNLADAYAVRTGNSTELMGRVHGLDVQQHALSDECSQADNGFWALDRGLVIWYSGALNTETEAGTLALYSPQNNATVATDGENVYVWESGKPALTQVQLNGTTTEIYAGDLTQAADMSDAAPAESVDPNATAGALEGPDVDPNGGSGWFDSFMDDESSKSSGGSSSGTVGWPGATPIGATATPAPTATAAPVSGSASSGGSSSGSSSSSKSSSSSSGTRYTTGSINLRSGPGLGYSSKRTIPKGKKLTITDRSTDSRGVVWYKTKYDGTTGWVSSKYLSTSASSSSGSSASGTRYTTGSVNLRSGPGLGYSSKRTIPKGKKLTITEKSTDSRGVVWYKTKYDGTTGWVSSKNLSKSASGSSSSSSSASGTRYTTGKVNLRSGPGLSYSSKRTIPKGKKLTITDKSTDSRGVVWYKTKYDGTTGWVSSKNLSKSKPSSGSSSGGSSSGKSVISSSVTIRSKPDKTSKALGTIPSGKKAEYLGTSKKDSRGVVWYKIKYKGITGWVSSRYSRLS